MNEARSLQAVINCAAYLRCLKALQTRGVTEVTAAELAKAAQEENEAATAAKAQETDPPPEQDP